MWFLSIRQSIYSENPIYSKNFHIFLDIWKIHILKYFYLKFIQNTIFVTFDLSKNFKTTVSTDAVADRDVDDAALEPNL